MIVTVPVAVTITAGPGLAERLNSTLNDLKLVIEQMGPEAELTEADAEEYPSLDPALVSLFFEIAKTAGQAVVGLIARELCLWIWREIKSLRENRTPEPIPSIVQLTVGRTKIELKADPTEAERAQAIEACSNAMQTNLSQKPTGV